MFTLLRVTVILFIISTIVWGVDAQLGYLLTHQRHGLSWVWAVITKSTVSMGLYDLLLWVTMELLGCVVNACLVL